MGIPINPEKLKLKYELKVHRKAPSWPSAEDLVYEMARYLEFQDNNIVPMSRLRDIVSNDEDRLQHLLGNLQKKKIISLNAEGDKVELLKHPWS